MAHEQRAALGPSVRTRTDKSPRLCNSHEKLTRFACVTLTYRISQRQENPVCPERKAAGGTGGWQAGCTVGTLSRCLSNLGAPSAELGRFPEEEEGDGGGGGGGGEALRMTENWQRTGRATGS